MTTKQHPVSEAEIEAIRNASEPGRPRAQAIDTLLRAIAERDATIAACDLAAAEYVATCKLLREGLAWCLQNGVSNGTTAEGCVRSKDLYTPLGGKWTYIDPPSDLRPVLESVMGEKS